ncbi:MAG: phosphoribosylanthranilate isomerase [Cyclonatronaceae bacterium]
MQQVEFPRLKICGITTLEDARFAAGAMADYLGFLFYPGSPRYLSPRKAAEISGWIEGPEKVGVFVNQNAAEINEIVERVGLDLVQLHGDESPSMVSDLSVPVIKAFRIESNPDVKGLKSIMSAWEPHADFFLMDSKGDGGHGGTGKTWDWGVIRDLVPQRPFFLAGGVATTNVTHAVRTIRPYAIDLSSSIEDKPGIKDFEKMQDFFDQWNHLRDESDELNAGP